MAEDSARAGQQPVVAPLPQVEDLPVVDRGLDEQRVREAFEAFRRHVVQLQAQLRVLTAAGRTADVEPTGHVLRMDALHLIRQAAEFADVIERDAQRASASQLRRAAAVMARTQQGAEQLLAAAGLGEPAVTEVVEAIMRGYETEQASQAPQAAAPPVSKPTSAAKAPQSQRGRSGRDDGPAA